MKKISSPIFYWLIGVLIVVVAFFFFIKSYVSNETAKSNKFIETSQAKKITPKETTTSTESTSSIQETSATSEVQQVSLPNEEIAQLDEQYIETISPTTSLYIQPLMDNGQFYGRNESEKIRAASVIKLFLLELAYQQVANNELNLEETYSLQASDIVGGTGNIQSSPVGTVFTYQELLAAMIINSDNTASNIILKRLGGLEAVNQTIQNLGYHQTNFGRYFMDTNALATGVDNYTSSKDIGELLTKLYHKQLVSESLDQSMLDLLAQTTNHQKLSNALVDMSHVYEKTGEFSEYGVQNDAMIMEKNDKAFVVVVLSQDGNESQQMSQLSQFGTELSNLLFQ